MPMFVRYIIVAIAGYLLGSISFGMLLTKANGGPDLRTVGSKNTGATNVLRVMGTKLGLIVFFADAFKAMLACGIGAWVCGWNDANISYGMLIGGLFVVLGHNWPVFFQFKGGKGVASSCGVMLICFPVQALICFVLGATAIALTRFVSLGSMVVGLAFAVLVSLWPAKGDIWIICWAVLIAVLIIVRHRANIGRLLQHKENKLSFTKNGTAGK